MIISPLLREIRLRGGLLVPFTVGLRMVKIYLLEVLVCLVVGPLARNLFREIQVKAVRDFLTLA